jgi:type IV pilus assembly protein PilC
MQETLSEPTVTSGEELPESADLADFLSPEETPARMEEMPEQQKRKKQEQEDIPGDLLEKKPEDPLVEGVEADQKEGLAAQSRAEAVAAKRKKSQAMEITIQTPVHKEKKEEKKIKENKVDPPEPPTEEQMLQAVEARAKRERKKGFSAFLRSLNNIGMGKQRSAFVQNLAMMLNAGLPLIDSLQTIREELRSKPMRKVIQQISDLVEGGNPLWISMDEQGLFSPYEVSLVRVGEEAGNLARNMELLSVQQEKDHNLRQKVKMAMIYPTIVLVLMFIVVMGLGMFVLPNLIQVLYALNVDLPFSTRVVINFTEFMQKHGAVTGVSIIGAFIGLALLTKYTPFKVVTQWCIFRIPGIGRLAKEASIARFGVILGGLLQAGVPLVESLDSMVEVTTIISFKKFYCKLRDRVVVGDSFATCFHSIHGSRKVLPISVQQLVITGEKSGALSDTCMKVAHIYERKAEETAEKLPIILEPTLLLCIGSLVGFIAFSIIVPIYSAVGNVGGG